MNSDAKSCHRVHSVRRKGATGLLDNERRVLLALQELGGRSWSRPLLDELDRQRTDGMRTGPGTLLRAMATFEKRGWIRSEEAFEPLARRYYVLEPAGIEVADALVLEQRRRAEYEKAAALVDGLLSTSRSTSQ